MYFVYNSVEDISDAFKPFMSEVNTDVLGNIISHKTGKGKRLLLIAHHDVVRLMISHIDENGFLYVKPAGCIDISILPARKVIIRHEDKSIVGIIGKKAVHLLREELNNKIAEALNNGRTFDYSSCTADDFDRVPLSFRFTS